MKVEIDQSGKVEETEHDTILATSKGNTVKITARTKRRLQETFRKIGRPRNFVIYIFAVSVFELIHKDLKSMFNKWRTQIILIINGLTIV